VKRKRIRLLIFSLIHALWMVPFTFFLVEVDWVHGDEAWLIKNTSAILRLLLPETDKPDPKDFAFINVAWDKMLVDRLDAEGFPSGNRAIVDRVRLNQLLQHIKANPVHKFLLTDVVFLDPTPVDSAMTAAVTGLPRAAFSVYRLDSGVHEHSVIPLPMTGLVEYHQIDNDFMKFRLVRDSIKSMPIRMFEEIDGGKFEKGTFFSWRNGKMAQNDFVLEMRIRQYDLTRPDRQYAYVDLHTLTDLLDIGQAGQVSEFIKDRIVVIGDFEDRDVHETMFGETAGPLILTNLYIALHNGDNLVHPGFFVYLYVVFFFMSIGLQRGTDWVESLVMRAVGGNSLVWQFLLQGAVITLTLAIVSVVSYLLFNIHINFLLLSFYFQIWEWGKLLYKRRKLKQLEAVRTAEALATSVEE
jgi:hypothetical protein